MNEYFKFTHPKALAALNAVDKSSDTNSTTQIPPIYSLNDGHSIVMGSQYVIKVDSVLRCPVFESGDAHVYDIEHVLTNYYSDSDSDSAPSDDDDDDCESAPSDDIAQSVGNGNGNGDDTSNNRENNTVSQDIIHDDQEFEMIEEPVTK
jgi:hypothetical protein